MSNICVTQILSHSEWIPDCWTDRIKAKAREPNALRWTHGTVSWWTAAVRSSWQRPATSDTEVYWAFTGPGVSSDTCTRVCYITCRLLQHLTGSCTKGHDWQASKSAAAAAAAAVAAVKTRNYNTNKVPHSSSWSPRIAKAFECNGTVNVWWRVRVVSRWPMVTMEL